jgi:hypothetical protein
MCGIGEFEGPLRVGYATCVRYTPETIVALGGGAQCGQKETFDAATRIVDTRAIPISSITRWAIHFRVPVRNLGTPLIRLIGCRSR